MIQFPDFRVLGGTTVVRCPWCIEDIIVSDPDSATALRSIRADHWCASRRFAQLDWFLAEARWWADHWRHGAVNILEAALPDGYSHSGADPFLWEDRQ